MPTTRSGYAPVENGELYYDVTGEGPALLLIHAGVADHTMWEPQLEPFSRSHMVITYDTRGFQGVIAEISSVGPIGFYARTAGASVSRVFRVASKPLTRRGSRAAAPGAGGNR